MASPKRMMGAPDKELGIVKLAEIRKAALREAAIVPNPHWRQAYERLAASVEDVLRLHINSADCED